jgi:hypothetical protein
MHPKQLTPTALLLALTLATPPPALAAEADDETEVRYAPRTTLTFGAVDVLGELVLPTIEHVEARRRARFRVLVRVRSDFVPELTRSIDAL